MREAGVPMEGVPYAERKFCRALFWMRTPWGVYPIVPLRGAAMLAARDAPSRSPFVLLEEGKPLWDAHALHDDIRTKGAGRYSHWQDPLYFSTSDGSDPRTNARRYVLAEFARDAVRVHVDFGSPAVRP